MAHIFGILAVVAFVLSYQFKTRKSIIAVNLLSRVLYILQYVCLCAYEGAVLDFMGFLFSFLAGFKKTSFVTKYVKIIVSLTVLILIGVGLILYKNIFSLFAIGGIVFEVVALWLTKEKNIRILSLIAAPFWLIYNLANAAYGSMVGNVFAIFSIGIAIVRLDLNRGTK